MVHTTMHRAYSLVEIKGFDPVKRTFSGTATSPVPDRVGDVIESAGVKANGAIPLMLYHDSRKPVGEARLGKAGKNGTPFDALISTIDRESGVVKERLDEAVDSLAAKPPLIRGVSIGFRPTKDPVYNKETGGFTFPEIEVLELSMVTIPAHQDATIDLVKSLDSAARAASGITGSEPPSSAGASASSRGSVVFRKGNSMKKPIADQIRELEATLTEKQSEMEAIQTKASDEGRSKDAAERESFDTLKLEIKSLTEEIADLRELENIQKSTARPVTASTAAEGAAARAPLASNVVQIKQNVPPGIGFARVAICKMAAFMSQGELRAHEVAKARYPHDERVQAYFKAAVAAGTTTDSTWAAPLVDQTTLASEFVDYLRPMTIVGKFGSTINGVTYPGLRPMPFNVRVPTMTSGTSASWVGEGVQKPLTKGAFDAVTMPYTKIAAISVITKELARFSSPSAERIVRDDLAKAIVARMDVDFIDPAIAAVSGVKPASITNGATTIASAGTSEANIRTDIQNLLEVFILANVDPTSLVLIMPNTLCLVLSQMVNSLGQPSFPQMTMRGGYLNGIPVIGSQHAAFATQYGNVVVAVNANDIGLADDGGVDISVSGEASLEMSDDPANESGTVVSMFQTNSLAILAERFVHWKKLRSTAASYIDDVNWGSIGSPA